jgi:hypothetical protein
MEILLKATILSSIVAVIIGSVFLIPFLNESSTGIEKINMKSELHPCEILTDQMIETRNTMKQYALNPSQFSSEEAEKINNEYRNELNRISKEFSLKGCDKNLDDWITPELTQKVIDQTGG